jgi:hypothetical protein
MRASVIWWSATSGAILGVFIDAILLGVALLFSSVVPVREYPRWLLAAGVVALAAVLLAMTVLGFLEGRLKVS